MPELTLVRPPRVGDPPALQQRSDDDLMLLARGGVRDAFDTLVRRHQSRVLGVAARLLGQTELAPDAAQNTFLAIYRALGQYQPKGKFPSYLYRVLANQCRMTQRAARTRERALLAVVNSKPARKNVTDDAVLARERQRELMTALGALSPKLRQVVVLRYSADLSYEEIAEACGIPLGTVKRRLFDAMGKLRGLLEGQ